MSAQTTTSSTHPLLPPTTEDECVSWLRLLRSRRVGISTFYRLMAEHGNADSALAALPDIATKAGLSKYTPCSQERVHAERAAAKQIGARMLCIGSQDYPSLLAQIPDAPPILWMRGNPACLKRPMIALVGARNASSLGTRMTRSLARDLADAGFVVVSGLARGIDTCAHLASAKAGSIAVLAGGVDVIYPSENLNLADDLLEAGALVSEQPLGMAPIARHFPVRNRIISGLCRATIVLEAAGKSGSLITARGALDQGRDVFAVPGHPFDARASGCNMLIRDGATLVRGAHDIIEALGAPEVNEPISDAAQAALDFTPSSPPAANLRTMNELHQQILDQLGPSPIAEDQLLRDVGLRAGQMMPILTNLELDGQIRRAPGGMISRA